VPAAKNHVRNGNPTQSWKGWTFTSKDLRERFVPWLQKNVREDQRVVDFMNVPIDAGIVREHG
jgi:hypothetical protein